ncbi:MAG: cation:proton antiporter [Burkholderiaceae bacterium]|nr:cation:proton antiporter [Burkholderiaceae bacterium]
MSPAEYPFLPAWPPAVTPLAWVAVLLLSAIVVGEATRRWLHVSRVVGYLLVGAVLGPHAAGVMDVDALAKLRIFSDIAVGLLLFELGQRVDLGWLRRNPWLFVTSVLEALLTFVAVFAVMRLFDVRAVTAAAAGVLAIATSPAVVITLVKDLRAQGQVTERVILFTALNTTYAVVGLALIFGWLHFESARASIMIVHPLYLIIGSLVLAALLAAAMILLLRVFGRRPAFQLSITVSFVLLTVAAASALELPVPLTLLLAGMLGRIFDRDRNFVSLRFGQTAMLFVVLLFTLAGAGLDFHGWLAALPMALGFIAARYLGKLVPIILLARPSSLTARKASLVQLGLSPMSGLALLMLADLAHQAPVLAQEIAASIYLAVAILAFAGPLALQFALVRAGETEEDDK